MLGSSSLLLPQSLPLPLDRRAVLLSLRKESGWRTAEQLTRLWEPTFDPTLMVWHLEQLRRGGFVAVRPSARGTEFSALPDAAPPSSQSSLSSLSSSTLPRSFHV